MAASTVTESGGVRIITELIPATDPRAAQLCPSPPGPPPTSLPVKAFRRAQPKVLGIIHILTGLTHLCFGLILTLAELWATPSLPVATGVFFWLGLQLLISGSLLVESEKRDSLLLVKSCCVTSVGVTLSTLVATLLHATAITQEPPGCEHSRPPQLRPQWCFSTHSKTLSDGLDSISIILCQLEFCTAVAALAFGSSALRQQSYSPMEL